MKHWQDGPLQLREGKSPCFRPGSIADAHALQSSVYRLNLRLNHLVPLSDALIVTDLLR